MKIKTAVPAIFLATMMLAACNTIEGAGRDVEAAGGAISETSREVQEEITN